MVAIRRLSTFLAGLSLTAVAAKLLKLWLQVRRQKRMLANVPEAKYQPSSLGWLAGLVANIHRLHDWRKEISEGLPVCKMIGLPIDTEGPMLVLRDPQAVKHMLKDNFNVYTKPARLYNAFWYYMHEFLGAGLFTVQHGVGAPDGGHSWTKQRKIASGIFSRANFNSNMGVVFAAKAEHLAQSLEKAASQGQQVDMQRQFFNFTMDSIMQIFFGEATDTVGGAVSKYGAAYDAAHQAMMDLILPKALFFKLACLLPWPVGGVAGLVWKLIEGTSAAGKTFRSACRTLDEESSRLVRACRKDPNLAQRTDLLALFVKCEEEEQFSETFLRDVVLNFIIAGRDTTACTLSWLFYILATNPEVQEELCKELDAKAPRTATGEVSFKQLAASELPYLHGVLYETLRLFPPVPFDGKHSSKDDVLPDGTPVPKGCDMLFLPYAMGRDESVYPDPLKVDPRRWIPFADPPPHEFPVFQAGPRICLGKDMAIFEAKLVVCRLLRDYTFRLADGEAEKITYNNTLTMTVCNSKTLDSHNLWLVPSRRQHFWREGLGG